jgi:hypothetical protein
MEALMIVVDMTGQRCSRRSAWWVFNPLKAMKVDARLISAFG